MSEEHGGTDGGEVKLAPVAERPAVRPAVRPVSAGVPVAPPWERPEDDTLLGYLAPVVLVVVTILYAWGIAQYYGGAHPGVDQNGYLVTARLLQERRSIYFVPEDAWQFAGKMCVMVSPAAAAVSPPSTAPSATAATAPSTVASTVPAATAVTPASAPATAAVTPLVGPVRPRRPRLVVPAVVAPPAASEPAGTATNDAPAYRIYAKYPPGFPLLAAIGRWLGGIDGMYWVNPLCTVLAGFFSYFLFRTALKPLTALVGTLWLMCHPLTLVYAHDANSHASVLFCVVVGYWGLLSGWQKQQWWRGFIGAFALGYACTVRYSEFLQVLPVAFAAAANLRWERKRIFHSLAVLAGWAIPVGTLAIVCWVSFGAPWKTGYSFCREDTGFGWKYFLGDNNEPTNVLKQGNWLTLLEQLNHIGLFIIWPLAVLGLVGMLGKAWRLGAVLGLWVLPSTALYMFYYWAPQGEQTVGYLRFFVPMVPGFLLAGLWFAERALATVQAGPRASLVLVTIFAAALVPIVAMAQNPDLLVGAEGTFPVNIVWPVGQALGEFYCSWVGWAVTAGVGAFVAGIWLFDRGYAGEVAVPALALAAMAALGCGLDVEGVKNHLEGQQLVDLNLRMTTDSVKHALPEGSVLFAPEVLCNDLDAVGGYRLYSTQLFAPQSFLTFKKVYDLRDKGRDNKPREADSPEDPHPLQYERAEFYMKLLGTKAGDTWVPKGPEELRQMQLDIIQKALDRGLRVAYLTSSQPALTASLPVRRGFKSKLVASWVSLPPLDPDTGVAARAGKKAALRNPPLPPAGLPVRGPMGGKWELWEIVVAAVRVPAGTSAPATRP